MLFSDSFLCVLIDGNEDGVAVVSVHSLPEETRLPHRSEVNYTSPHSLDKHEPWVLPLPASHTYTYTHAHTHRLINRQTDSLG